MKSSIVRARSIQTDGLPALSIRERADALRYEDSLADFIAASWRFVEPMAFKGSWHIDAICEHLEAVADWQINRLLINLPPRHMKSLGANVFFPAWIWANRADPFAAQCEHGFVKMVEGPWNHTFVEELCAFPNGAHDDQVDAASAAFRAVIRQSKFSAVGVRF